MFPPAALKQNIPALSKASEHVFFGSDSVYKGDTLFMRGTKANFITDEHMAGIKQLFPNSTLQNFDAGHWLHAEMMASFTDSVANFLQHK